MNTKIGRLFTATVATIFACGLFTLPVFASADKSDVIIEWNRLAQQYNSGPPFSQSRTYAMVHIAMADAVVAIEGDYKPYHAKIQAWHGASATAAAAQAAHDVLVALLPANQAAFDSALAARLDKIPPSRRPAGVQVGEEAAEKILAWRQHDGMAAANPQNPSPFLPSTLPGIWRESSTGPALFPLFGMVMPFGLLTSTQFLPIPQPQLESAEYAADFNDVYENGGQISASRTEEQKTFALVVAGQPPYFNVTNPLRLWQNVATDMALADKMSLVDTARLFALVTASVHDSLQTAHTSKFVYRLWRPETAVPAADADNNADTTADLNWKPLLVTPPYPSHASNMACIATGAAHMLANILGTDARNFTARWYTAGDSPEILHAKNYGSFFALAQDVGSSRVWGGIHFRFEVEASEDACMQVADYLFDNYMRPTRKRSHH
ncbi:MAG: vanadium-dependent haloperoxidase [Woeseia sp.]